MYDKLTWDSAAATHIHSSLLSLSVGAVLMPAAYHFMLGSEPNTSSEVQKQNILHMSHAVRPFFVKINYEPFFILRLNRSPLCYYSVRFTDWVWPIFSHTSLVYFAYLLFQLWSHTHFYNDQHNKKSSRLSATRKEKRTNRKFKSEDIPLSRTSSQPDFAKLDSSLPLAPPGRPFAYSLSNTSSDVTLTSRVDSSSERGPYFPRGTLANHSAYEIGGVPMSRTTTLAESISSRAGASFPLSREEPHQYELDDRTTTFRKEPQLSWFMTIFLLIVVTGVGVRMGCCVGFVWMNIDLDFM